MLTTIVAIHYTLHVQVGKLPVFSPQPSSNLARRKDSELCRRSGVSLKTDPKFRCETSGLISAVVR